MSHQEGEAAPGETNKAIVFAEEGIQESTCDRAESTSEDDAGREAAQANSAMYLEMARSALDASVDNEYVEIASMRLFSLDEIDLEKLNKCTALSLRKNLIHVMTPLPLHLANRLVDLDLFDNKIRKVGKFFVSAMVENTADAVTSSTAEPPLSAPEAEEAREGDCHGPSDTDGAAGVAAPPKMVLKSFDRPFLALTKVDLSYNQIRKIDGFDSLASTLKELYLIENKIKSLDGVSKLVNLELLELGGNRIREIGCHLDTLVNLRQLWLGKNKIQRIGDSLHRLRQLELLSLQANRIEAIDPDNFVEGANPVLSEIYLSENGIKEIEHVPVHSVVLLDFSFNPLARINAQVINADNMPHLEEFWLTDAKVESWDEVAKLACFKDTLRTVYLERNPIEEHRRYRDVVYQHLPFLTQIDSWPVRNKGNLEADRTIQRKRTMTTQQVHPDLRRLNDQLRPLLLEMRELSERKSKSVESRRQLGAQKSENELVKEELGKLEPDAMVYKLIGPALIPQDQADAKSIVGNRLEYIDGEIKRVDTSISDMDRKEAELQKKAQDLYRKMQERHSQIVQQKQQPQQ